MSRLDYKSHSFLKQQKSRFQPPTALQRPRKSSDRKTAFEGPSQDWSRPSNLAAKEAENANIGKGVLLVNAKGVDLNPFTL
jgi:hypothetical protein